MTDQIIKCPKCKMEIPLTKALTDQSEIVCAKKYEVKASNLEKIIAQLIHELKTPIVAIRGVVDFMKHSFNNEKLSNHHYIEDILLWTELMGRLIDNADVFRYLDKDIPIHSTRTYVLTDIVIPAIRQVKLLLKARDFSEKKITYKGFENIPELWLDRNRFQQVVFNILSNMTAL